MRLRLLLSALLTLLVSSSADSSPLALPGDQVLRQDVQLLQGYGVVPGPVDSWPLSWSQLTDSLGARSSQDRLPRHVEAAARRLLAGQSPPHTFQLQFGGAVTNHRSLIYGFGGGARRDVDLFLSGQRTWNRVTARLNLGFQSESDTRGDVVLDGSYVSLSMGNWILFGGAPDRWYGPGWDGGLLLSRNARPVPGIGIFRKVPRQSRPGILRWMGPWRLDAAVGVLTGSRNDFSNPLNVNLRLAFQPWSRFDVALSRAMMICGDGRPCHAGSWLRSLFGVFDVDNSGANDDPSNQNASVALSYTFRSGSVQLSPLVEWFYEDEIDFASILAGTRVLVPAGDGTWRFQLEYTDTYANRILGIFDSPWWEVTPGKTYDHYIYTDGYVHQGRVIGHPVGGDGRLVTLETAFVGGSGWNVVSRFRYTEVRVNPLGEWVPILRDTFVAELGGELPIGRSRVGLGLRWMEDDPFADGGTRSVWEIEAAYRARVDLGP